MDVELRHPRCLIAIVDAGGFTGAAAQLHLSQPAMSRTLAGLEVAGRSPSRHPRRGGLPAELYGAPSASKASRSD
jgi:hypothetical protein